MITFSPYKLIRQLLPTFLRTPVRTAWLEALLAPLAAMWVDYVAWRAERYYDAHVTPQTISIEAYLNRLFDPTHQRIHVRHGEDESVYVALRSEGYADFYINGEDGKFIGLLGEMNNEVISGFTVEIPPGIDATQVSGIVRSTKATGVQFEVVIVNS